MPNLTSLHQKVMLETAILALIIVLAISYLSTSTQWRSDPFIYDTFSYFLSANDGPVIDQSPIRTIPPWLAFSVSSVGALIMLITLAIFRLRRPFLICLGLVVALLALSLVLLALGWWSAPSVGITGVLAAYVLGSWRRQNALVIFYDLKPTGRDLELNGRAPCHGGSDNDDKVSMETLLSHVNPTQRFVMQSLDSLPLAVFLIDLQGVIKLANLSATELDEKADYTTRPLIGQDIFNVLLTLEQPRTDPQYYSPWSHSETSVERLAEQFIHARSGKSYKMQLARLDTEQHELTGWLLVLLDLTVEHLAKEQCTSMVRFLSHDLRAPQSAILALLEIQQRTKTPMAFEELRGHIEQQIQRTLFLTDGFIQLAEIRSKPLTFEPLFIGATILDAIDQAWPLAKQKMIRVEHTFDDDDTCMLNGSEELLTRAIFNLLENAIKYSEPNTVIRIKLEPCDSEIAVTLSDEGRGISKEDLPKLFEEFSQFGISNTRGSGYGLGMAIVKNVIQRHNARIECSSELGVGTTFKLYFRAA